MKNILLIQAPSPIDKEYRFIPFSLAYLAAFLERYGFRPEIYDMDALSYGVNQFAKDYPYLDYDVIGISSHTVSYQNAIKIARIAKSINNKAIIVFGGYHVTFLPREVFNDSSDVDIVVIGEGESTFLEIVTKIDKQLDRHNLSNIKGIAYLDAGKVAITGPREVENINDLPFPARHLLPMDKYSANTIITSRGCPNKCAFCVGSAMHAYRIRNVTNIVDEIKYMLQHDTHFNQDRSLVFMDNTFINPKITYDLCERIKPLDLTWTVETRISNTTPDILTVMKESGCIYVHFGIESGSQRILERMNKNISLVDAKQKIDHALSLGLIVACTFSIGHPYETEEDIEQTIQLIKELKSKGVTISTSIVTPYPGTEIWEYPDIYQVNIEHRKWDKYSFFNPVMSTKYLTSENIGSIFVRLLNETRGYIEFGVSQEV